MGRGCGKKNREFSIYDVVINTEKQWESLLETRVNHFVAVRLITQSYLD